MTALGDLLSEVQSGFACGEQDEGGIFQFRMNNVTRQGSLDLRKRRRVPETAHRDMTRFHLQSGDVLFNSTNSPDGVGKSVLVRDLDETAVFSNHFLRLRVDPKRLDPGYLARWLNWQFGRGVFEGMCRQWVNQATVGREALLDMALEVPPTEEQRRISAIMDQADALRTKRRQTIALLDDLTHSLFVDMFGTPLVNERTWPLRPIHQWGTVVTGNTPPRANPNNYGPGVEWIKSDDVHETNLSPRFARETLSATGEGHARVVPPGSILVVCIAGSPTSIGRCAMLDRRAAFNQQLNALVPTHGNPRFALAQLRAAPQLVRRQSTGGMKGLVSKSQFSAIELMDPPLEMQEDFARRLNVLDTLRERMGSMGEELEHLVSALQAEAFAGRP